MMGDIETGNYITEEDSVKGKKEGIQDRAYGINFNTNSYLPD